MADESEKFRSMPVFWSRDDDKSGNIAIIPGITRMAGVGNLRPKVKGHRTKEVKAGIPRHQPLVDELTPKKAALHEPEEDFETSSDKENSASLSSQQTFTKESNIHKSYSRPRPKHALLKDLGSKPHPRNHSRKASLSDLCIEDKKRVAGLIKELAKLGEEKESAIEALKGERNQFEEKIGSLIDQKDNILQERADIESQLEECQQLLLKYQDRIQRHQESLQDGEEVPPRASTPLKTPQQEPGCVTSPRSARNASYYTPKQTNVPNIEPSEGQGQPVAPPPGHYMVYPPYMPVSYPYPYPVRPDMQRPLPTPNQRVYTNKIDADIAEERFEYPADQFSRADVYRPELNGYRSESGEHWVKPELYYEATGNEPPRDYYAGHRNKYHGNGLDLETHRHRGPLNDPLLSSTQRSGADLSHIRNDRHFEPLVPDMSESYVSVQAAARGRLRNGQPEYHNSQNGRGGGVYRGHRQMEGHPDNHRQREFEQNGKQDFYYERDGHRVMENNGYGHVNDARHNHRDAEWNHRHIDEDPNHRELDIENSPISTNFHDHVNGDSFGTYYKKLSPEQRRKQMVVQKEALLREQHRLRKILQEQEGMLKEKQLKLHRQQEKQRRRMKTFEKTGEFPLATDTEESGPEVAEENHNHRQTSPTFQRIPTSVQKSVIDTGTSPLRFIEEPAVPETPQYMDAGTEMTQSSHVTPLLVRASPQNFSLDDGCRRISSPSLELDAGRQGNLPLVYNRQRTTPRSASLDSPPSSERALSVVEIVDSLEQSEPMFSPHYAMSRGSHQSDDGDNEEEESRLLEDVFFLK